jgi:hypothetical protein
LGTTMTKSNVYMSAVLDQLRSEGHNVDDGDVVHLSPAHYARDIVKSCVIGDGQRKLVSSR